MEFMDTREPSIKVSFHDALFGGLATEGGLYIPTQFPTIPADAMAHIKDYSLTQLGQLIMPLFLPEISAQTLRDIVNRTLNFPIPLIPLEKNLYLLEVFHGPSLAFKDVGARFMANMLSYYLEQKKQHMTILVATSGDTGSAIAQAFNEHPLVDVYIFYPSKKITHLQEQQMTTLSKNIHAIEVQGTFDDCQRLVKTALLDPRIKAMKQVTTANSINIARLLPQIVYHSWGLVQLMQQGVDTPPVLSVPSGNLGNLTAALYANKMGFKVNHFIAATNINTSFPDYLKTGTFSLPHDSPNILSII